VLAATGDRALVAELPEAEVAALAAQAGRRSATTCNASSASSSRPMKRSRRPHAA